VCVCVCVCVCILPTYATLFAATGRDGIAMRAEGDVA
jgi:hypothetical protein